MGDVDLLEYNARINREHRNMKKLIKMATEEIIAWREKWRGNVDDRSLMLVIGLLNDVKLHWRKLAKWYGSGRSREFAELLEGSLDTVIQQIKWAAWEDQISITEYLHDKLEEEGSQGGKGSL